MLLGFLGGLIGLAVLGVSTVSVICWGWYRGVYRRYRCKSCLRTFNDKSGTDFEYSRILLMRGFS
jgi:hypothetical protein